MQASEIAACASAFLSGVNALDPRLQARLVELREDAGQFSEIFRDPVPPQSGVYWFFVPDGPVFYIGKAEGNIWKRIFQHTGTPSWHGDEAADHRNTIGDGWGFPAFNKLANSRASETTKSAILNGGFHVGWAATDPWQVAVLLEVYLQALCIGVDRVLPELCDKIG